MLSDRGFDLWADDYDRSVGLCDEEGAYPFAGYRAVLGEIYRRVLEGSARSVLDIGFGTGVLAARLYERGCEGVISNFPGVCRGWLDSKQ